MILLFVLVCCVIARSCMSVNSSSVVMKSDYSLLKYSSSFRYQRLYKPQEKTIEEKIFALFFNASDLFTCVRSTSKENMLFCSWRFLETLRDLCNGTIESWRRRPFSASKTLPVTVRGGRVTACVLKKSPRSWNLTLIMLFIPILVFTSVRSGYRSKSPLSEITFTGLLGFCWKY